MAAWNQPLLIAGSSATHEHLEAFICVHLRQTLFESQNGPSLYWIAKPHSSTPEAHSEKVQRAFT